MSMPFYKYGITKLTISVFWQVRYSWLHMDYQRRKSRVPVPRVWAAWQQGTAGLHQSSQVPTTEEAVPLQSEYTFIMTNLFEHGSQSNLINLALKTNGTKLNCVRIINVYHCTWERFRLSSCFTPYGEFCSCTKDIYIGRGQYLVLKLYNKESGSSCQEIVIKSCPNNLI